MKQLNFVIIFIFCLAFAVFTIQNTESTIIHVVPNLQVQAPIAVELFLAMGLGAVLAWLFSMWTHLQQIMTSSQKVRQKDIHIQDLETKVEQYQTEIQSLKLALPPAASSSTTEIQLST